jgi:hypothetical protein
LDRGEVEFINLTKDTITRFEDGIQIDEFPKTFQHAMDFACRLGVRYIWIDSLCILQDSQKDWLYQSAQMDQVYNNSLCNISATAASNSSKGLYMDRDSKQHWVGEVALNTKGIPGQPPPPAEPKPKDKIVPKYTIMNLEFWETTVDQAPVNRRAWVLQERLIAPRVLHFCHEYVRIRSYFVDSLGGDLVRSSSGAESSAPKMCVQNYADLSTVKSLGSAGKRMTWRA